MVSDEAERLCQDYAVSKLEVYAPGTKSGRPSESYGRLTSSGQLGTLLLKRNGRWGTVCDDQFTDTMARDFNIDKLFVHPHFDVTTEFNNDLAILKLEERIRFNHFVQPACLPDPNKYGLDYHNYHELSCTIVGWGTLSERSPPIPHDTPRGGHVSLYPSETCVGSNKYSRDEVTTGMLCAGDLNGTIDTCTGDSGGPLVCTSSSSIGSSSSSSSSESFLLGITSWGKGCGRVGSPGLYTKIVKYLKWISEVVG
ncbi:salivary plasminogen activator gamma-like [Eriocheir sinensis]|uniref:salivary plasminogen activator gamma-like n=1 Tax=Eriocheir sinensis TaxID=95602 RepID=UPI0021C7D481|nr:salivary plasminogen activator gamma-like [Eriocheir sinensis]